MRDHRIPDLTGLRIEIEEPTRAEHRRSLHAAIETSRRPQRHRTTRWQRWAIAMAVVSTTVVPVGAVASEQALPGDLLYPIKRFVEPVVQIFDPNVVAIHRIEELEAIDSSFSRTVIDDLIADARRAVEDRPDDDLDTRLESAIDALTRPDQGAEGEEPPPPSDSDAVGDESTDRATDGRDDSSPDPGGDARDEPETGPDTSTPGDGDDSGTVDSGDDATDADGERQDEPAGETDHRDSSDSPPVPDPPADDRPADEPRDDDRDRGADQP